MRTAEVEMAKTLIENLAAKWDPARTTTATATSCSTCSQQKAEGEPLPEPQRPSGGEVVDLMEALRQSVARPSRSEHAQGAAKRKAS